MNPKKAIFIRRMHRGRKVKSPLYDFYRDFWKFYKPGGHRWQYKGQNGFFRAALASRYSVRNIRIQRAKKNCSNLLNACDLIVCDSKAFLDNDHRQVMPIDFLPSDNGTVKVLLVANARPGVIPPDDILDRFDIVFKREPFIDRDRYRISESNKAKIRPTMLGCPLIAVKRSNVRQLNPASMGYRAPPEAFEHDVFFSGVNTARVREIFVKRLSEEPFDFFGGLQFRKRAPEVSYEFAFPRLNKDRYSEIIRKSRISLALEGEGPFTYRHLEAWYLCAFVMSGPGIRDLELPISAAEGKHYICYEDYEDLVAKIKYYLDRPDERNSVALAGRRMFEETFSYVKHGKYIESCVEQFKSGSGH